jgi:hypothetical protein
MSHNHELLVLRIPEERQSVIFSMEHLEATPSERFGTST